MDERINFFVGLDVHKDRTSITVCGSCSREAARFAGAVGAYVGQLLKVLAKGGEPSR